MWIVLRVAFTYFFIILALRGLGKREFAQLSAQEVILLLLLSETLQQAMVGDDFSMTAAVVAASTLMVCSFIVSVISYRFKRVERVLSGEPAVLAYGGKLIKRNMDLEHIPSDELYTEMRRVGLERIEQVKWALLETDGSISIIPIRPLHEETLRPSEHRR